MTKKKKKDKENKEKVKNKKTTFVVYIRQDAKKAAGTPNHSLPVAFLRRYNV